MKTGLCSITFRQLNVSQIVDLVKEAGLDAIEWGGDIHVKPGDTVAAEQARRLTDEAGLEISSYGSYYKVLDSTGTLVSFDPILETVLSLGADTVRIWAGDRPSELADAGYYARFFDALQVVLHQAEQYQVRVALEFHADTLMDSNAAALEVLHQVTHPNLFTYWQPIYWLSDLDYRLQGIRSFQDRILNLHVFHWKFSPAAGSWQTATDRRSLAEGAADWQNYLKEFNASSMERYALLEFVRQNDLDQFFEDAATLRRWMEGSSATESL